ncbi:hypothetical protein C8A03DRAFT_45131 [Achaetomium macrosporum]|uniref:Uncharacterized protein n=1 Tax=Achaetomium macrosporum TaxID=79813 RepID=A0AAN7H686_9PEZI|nr:hypothetical protein C8A03DRAFT_45131 [Achaetomium macrosporum]
MSLIRHLINAIIAAASITPRQSPSACSDGATIENLWLVERLNVTYTSDELVRPGNASWTITNTLTNTTERLSCTLRANYICELNGTPGDASFHIWLQINLDIATFTLNQSLPCRGETSSRSAYALGTAELYLICPTTGIKEDMSCHSDDDGTGFADGFITLLGPSARVRASRSLKGDTASGNTVSMKQRMNRWRHRFSDRGMEAWRGSSFGLSRGTTRTTPAMRPPLESLYE